MLPKVEDILWRDRLTDALAEAARESRAVVMKPAGQGYDPPTDEW